MMRCGFNGRRRLGYGRKCWSLSRRRFLGLLRGRKDGKSVFPKVPCSEGRAHASVMQRPEYYFSSQQGMFLNLLGNVILVKELQLARIRGRVCKSKGGRVARVYARSDGVELPKLPLPRCLDVAARPAQVSTTTPRSPPPRVNKPIGAIFLFRIAAPSRPARKATVKRADNVTYSNSLRLSRSTPERMLSRDIGDDSPAERHPSFAVSATAGVLKRVGCGELMGCERAACRGVMSTSLGGCRAPGLPGLRAVVQSAAPHRLCARQKKFHATQPK